MEPIPGKMLATMLDRFSKSFLDTRMLGLQAFLNRMTRHPILSCDPDVVAYVTLQDLAFADYRTKHSPANFLTNLFSEVRFNITANPHDQLVFTAGQSPEPPSIALTPTDSPPDLSRQLKPEGRADQAKSSQPVVWMPDGQSAEHRVDMNDFKGYTEETDHFVDTCQHLSHATDCIVGSLESLSSGFQEMANCLSLWPPHLTADDASDGSTSLTWFRAGDGQPQQQPQLIAKAADSVTRATETLKDSLRTGRAGNWKEMGSYAQSIRSVLNTRNDIERRYFETLENFRIEANSKSNNTSYTNRFSNLAKTYLPWGPKTLSELVTNSSRLQDQLTFANTHIRADFSRWQSERYLETVTGLFEMASAYASYYNKVSDIWRTTVLALEEENKMNKLPTDTPPDITKSDNPDRQSLEVPTPHLHGGSVCHTDVTSTDEQGD